MRLGGGQATEASSVAQADACLGGPSSCAAHVRFRAMAQDSQLHRLEVCNKLALRHNSYRPEMPWTLTQHVTVWESDPPCTSSTSCVSRLRVISMKVHVAAVARC